MRLTNKRLLGLMIPEMEKTIQACEKFVLAADKLKKGRLWREYRTNPELGLITCEAYKEDKCVRITVQRVLYGKYDVVLLDWRANKPDHFYFTKFLREKGNGFFALVDRSTGKIVKSEWD